MTSKEVFHLIADSFKELCQVKKLQFLQANRDNSLQVHQCQELDGNGVLTLAGCGSLYVHQMEESEDNNQNKPCISSPNDGEEPCTSASISSPNDGEEPCTSASITSPNDGGKRKRLFQRADELIKELRVSFLVRVTVVLCVCVSVYATTSNSNTVPQK